MEQGNTSVLAAKSAPRYIVGVSEQWSAWSCRSVGEIYSGWLERLRSDNVEVAGPARRCNLFCGLGSIQDAQGELKDVGWLPNLSSP